MWKRTVFLHTISLVSTYHWHLSTWLSLRKVICMSWLHAAHLRGFEISPCICSQAIKSLTSSLARAVISSKFMAIRVDTTECCFLFYTSISCVYTHVLSPRSTCGMFQVVYCAGKPIGNAVCCSYETRLALASVLVP